MKEQTLDTTIKQEIRSIAYAINNDSQMYYTASPSTKVIDDATKRTQALVNSMEDTAPAVAYARKRAWREPVEAGLAGLVSAGIASVAMTFMDQPQEVTYLLSGTMAWMGLMLAIKTSGNSQTYNNIADTLEHVEKESLESQIIPQNP